MYSANDTPQNPMLVSALTPVIVKSSSDMLLSMNGGQFIVLEGKGWLSVSCNCWDAMKMLYKFISEWCCIERHQYSSKLGHLNSLVPGRSECDFENAILTPVLLTSIFRSSYDNNDNNNIMLSYECGRNLLMTSQHWFRYWLCAIRQQGPTWANVTQVLCHHRA